jgi:hypothetical protein
MAPKLDLEARMTIKTLAERGSTACSIAQMQGGDRGGGALPSQAAGRRGRGRPSPPGAPGGTLGWSDLDLGLRARGCQGSAKGSHPGAAGKLAGRCWQTGSRAPGTPRRDHLEKRRLQLGQGEPPPVAGTPGSTSEMWCWEASGPRLQAAQATFLPPRGLR